MSFPETWQWALLIYDRNGHLVDIPQSDVVSIEVEDVINGGSGSGTVVFRRPFNTIGALAFRYLFQLFVWQVGTARPADPVWSGHFTDFDQKEMITTGEITAKLDGDFKLLDDGLVNITINPGIGGNPSLDAGPFISSMLSTYQSNANFGTAIVPSSMFPLEPTQFIDEALGDSLDTITKIGRDDTSGQLYVWFVRTKGDLTRKVVVQLDQNPNAIEGVKFIHLFKDAQLTNYLVQTKYSGVFNVLAVYGGQDDNGQQVYGVYKDETSITNLGATIEASLSNSSICSQAAAQTYAQNQLDLNSSPVAQGSFDLLEPNPSIFAGTWVQIWETPETATQEATIKQVRISIVKWSIKSERIVQTCSLQSPAPYLDTAIYNLGLEVDVNAAIQNSQNPANRQQLYVRAGGYVSSTADAAGSTPAKLATAPVEAVFPSVGLVSVAGFGLAAIVDNTGGASNGVTGDGTFTLSLTSSGTYVITAGVPPANTSTQQNLVSIWVQGGVPFTADARTLIAGMPSDPALEAPTLASGTDSVFITPPSTGGATFNQRVQFELATPPASSPWLAHFTLQAQQCDSSGTALVDSTGTAVPPSRSVDFSPQANNTYDVTIQLGSGSYWLLTVVSVDQHARVSEPLNLGNTANHPLSSGSLMPLPSGAALSVTATFAVTFYESTNTLRIDCTFTPTGTSFGSGSWITAIAAFYFYDDPSVPGPLSQFYTDPIAGSGLPSTVTCSVSGLPKNFAGATPSFGYGFDLRVVAGNGQYLDAVCYCIDGASNVTYTTHA